MQASHVSIKVGSADQGFRGTLEGRYRQPLFYHNSAGVSCIREELENAERLVVRSASVDVSQGAATSRTGPYHSFLGWQNVYCS